MEQLQMQMQIPIPDAVPSLNEWLEIQVRLSNQSKGELTGYQCSKCLNKGYIYFAKDGNLVSRECECIKTRHTLKIIHESGLEEQLRKCQLRNFETPEKWQQTMKKTAEDFIKSDTAGFFIGGQTGCGKTHICTAIVGNMIHKGMSARYFVWRDDSTALKPLVNSPEYVRIMRQYKQTDCLYIDDLFKQEEIRDADIRLAFELIDYRYRNSMKTIISTEMTDKELIDTDEALAGRILQMCRGFRMVIPKDIRKNYRLR